MIDWARVEELRTDMGDDGFNEVVALFLDEMDQKVSAIELDPTSGREANLHFLKGCAANVGFSELRDMCSSAEADMSIRMSVVLNCYARSKTEFLARDVIAALSGMSGEKNRASTG